MCVKATFKALITRICLGFWRGLVVSQSGGGLCCGASSWLQEGPSKLIVPFLACGDLRGFDADQSCPLPSTSGAGSEKAESAYQSLALVQPPIASPYWTPWNSRKSCYRKLSELFSALCHGCRWATLSCRWTTSVFFRKVLT